jgi:hypothetical protein
MKQANASRSEMSSIPVLFRIDQPLLERIEELRAARRPTIPSRATVLRELVETALEKAEPAKSAA